VTNLNCRACDTLGIDHSERELEGIEVTKSYDAVDENETDEQYMER
jgi:hypothetical protein